MRGADRRRDYDNRRGHGTGRFARPRVLRDNGPAANALLAFADLHNACDPRQPDFEQTTHLFVDPANNIFFTDSANQRIRKIDSAGVITTVAGTGDKPPVGGPPFCVNTGGASGIGDGGPATSAKFYYPGDVAVAPNGGMIDRGPAGQPDPADQFERSDHHHSGERRA